VTTQPGDQAAGAGGRGHLRASHADREQVVGTLKAAFVAGMLAKDEFDLRVGQALASRTCADLAALTTDLPAGLTAAQPPNHAQERGEARIPRPGRVLTVATVLYAGAWVYAVLSPNGGDNPTAGALIFWGGFLYLIVLLFAGAQILADRQAKRSGGQSSRRPSAGGPASARLPSADRDRQLPPGDDSRWRTAEAAPIVRPRLLPT
jgi:hypothetical protein